MSLPDIRAVIVALAFGALMGWGLSRQTYDRRPALWATVIGAASGLVTWTLAADPDWVLAGMSLTLGCGAGLLLLAVSSRR